MSIPSSSTSSIQLVQPPQQPLPSFRPEPNPSSRPTLPLTFLEFLSCLKTHQIIPIHKINDVVIPTLRQNFEKLNPRPPIDLQQTYDEVLGDLSHIEETLKSLKDWENRLNTLTKDLMLYDWEATSQTAIPDIKEKVSRLKSHISLPLETSSAAESSDTSDLPVPGNAASVLKWSTNSLETEAFKKFKTSYDELSDQQKESLLRFSFFPENALIKKKVPTYLWIGEGVIEPTATEDPEEAANQLFEDLIKAGFIEPVEKKGLGSCTVFSIKPDIRPALLTMANTKGFFDFNSDGSATTNSRRACLEKTEEGSLQPLSTFSKHDRLLTLFNINENCLDFPRRWLSKTKNFAVIHLGNWSSSSTENYIEAAYPNLLEDLRDAKFLKYLSLNGVSGIRKLPDSISTFESLNILDLKSCRDLEKLPNEIGLLTKLTHLDMSGCYLLDEMPKGLALLLELRVLKGFVIGRSSKGSKHCTLSDLVGLKKLKKFSLYADKETTGENGELNCLAQFKSLKILVISWIVSVPPNKKLNATSVELPSQPTGSEKSHMRCWPNKKPNATSVALPSLPAGLEKLDMRCWPLSTMPSWTKPRELNSLKKLYIRGGKLSGVMQLEARDSPQWTPVSFLRLKYLAELKMDGNNVRTLFPNLKYLEEVKCPELSSLQLEGVEILHG